MRKLLKYTIRTSSLVLAALAMVACNGEDNHDLPSSGFERTLVLQLDVAGSADNTRSTITEGVEGGNIDADGRTTNHALNETRINTVKVLIFNPDESMKRMSGIGDVYLPAANEGETNRSLTVNIPRVDWGDFNGSTEYTILILLNYHGEAITGSETLDEMRKKTLMDTYNTGAQPENFVMTGQCKWNINMHRYDDGDKVANVIEMTRVAAKIRARYPVLPDTIADYSPDKVYHKYILDTNVAEPVSVSLKHYRNKSYLEPDIISNPAIPESEWATDLPVTVFRDIDNNNTLFYSYPHEWKDTYAADKTCLEYRIYLKEVIQGGYGASKAYHYVIPIAGNEKNNPDGYNKVKRNHLYDILPVIETLGDPNGQEPVEIEGNYKIMDWRTKELDIQIFQVHYFVVKEHNVIMANTETHVNHFVATRKVYLGRIDEVYYYKYEVDSLSGMLERIPHEISPGDKGYPTVTVDNIAKTITIHAEILNNHSPKCFTATFVDEGGIEEQVHFMQYPPIYVTGEYSDEKYKDPNVEYITDPDRDNFNLFTITTITNDVFRTGNPSYIGNDGKVRTRDDAAANLLVSPKFIIASQRGITHLKTYQESETRCLNYAEGGYPIGSWRIPTRAELKFIDYIQDDPNSSISKLLNGERYWGAEKYYQYNFYTNSFLNPNFNVGWSPKNATDTGYIRCVHDVY